MVVTLVVSHVPYFKPFKLPLSAPAILQTRPSLCCCNGPDDLSQVPHSLLPHRHLTWGVGGEKAERVKWDQVSQCLTLIWEI